MEYVIQLIDKYDLQWYYSICKGDFMPVKDIEFATKFNSKKHATEIAEEFIQSIFAKDLFVEYKLIG